MGTHVEDVAASALLDSIAQKLQAQRSEELEPEGELIIFEGPEGNLQLARGAIDAPLGLLATESEECEEPCMAPPQPPAATTAQVSSVSSSVGDSAADEAASAVGDGGEALETVLVPILVGPFDSFASICMREHMDPLELMRVNGLAARHVRPGTTVLVWGQRSKGQQQAEMQRQLVAQFRRLTRTSAGEARYYLEESSYDMTLALAHRRDDLEWERSDATGSMASPLSFLVEQDTTTTANTIAAAASKESARAPPAAIFTSVLKCAQSFGVRCV